jgi:GAF domain-containing protein
MSAHVPPDWESFQTFLANAFAVQKSGLDSRSLSALVEVQHFIGTGEFSLDQALHLVADRALNVSSASGIALALLDANQLVYRAGSGTAAMDVGRHVPAVLSVCTPIKAGIEILRVENAKTDLRIEGEICRQFEATSLLILPIYRAQAVAGVLQVHFIDAHTFSDQEVRMYRLMAGLVEEAMSRNIQHDQKDFAKESVTVMNAVGRNTSQEQAFSDKDTRSAETTLRLDQSFGELVATESTITDTGAATRIQQKATRLSIGKFWRIGVPVTASALLTLAIWVAHAHQHFSPKMNASALSTPNDTADSTPPRPLARNRKSKRSTDGLKDTMAPNPAFRRSRIGSHEVDYISEDVTVRYFTNRPTRRQTRIDAREVNIGQDVTVRYFAHQSMPSQTFSAAISKQTTAHPAPASR